MRTCEQCGREILTRGGYGRNQYAAECQCGPVHHGNYCPATSDPPGECQCGKISRPTTISHDEWAAGVELQQAVIRLLAGEPAPTPSGWGMTLAYWSGRMTAARMAHATDPASIFATGETDPQADRDAVTLCIR